MVKLTRNEFYNCILSDWEVTDIFIDGKCIRSSTSDVENTLDDYFKLLDTIEREGLVVFWKEVKYIPNDNGKGVTLHMKTEIKMWRFSNANL